MLEAAQLNDTEAAGHATRQDETADGIGRVENRILALRRKHARLNMDIMVEQQRPLPDSLKLSALKRSKLAVKDELEALETTLRKEMARRAYHRRRAAAGRVRRAEATQPAA